MTKTKERTAANARKRMNGMGVKRGSFLFRLPYSDQTFDLDTILEVIDPMTANPNGKLSLREILRKYG